MAALPSLPKVQIVTRRVVEMSGCPCGHFATSRPYDKKSSYATKADALQEMSGEFLRHLIGDCRAASAEMKAAAQAELDAWMRR